MNVENAIELLIVSDFHSAPKLKRRTHKGAFGGWKLLSARSAEKTLKFVAGYIKSIKYEEELAGYPNLNAEIVKSLMKRASS